MGLQQGSYSACFALPVLLHCAQLRPLRSAGAALMTPVLPVLHSLDCKSVETPNSFMC